MTMGPTSGGLGERRVKPTDHGATYTGPKKDIPENERFNRKVKVTFTFAIDLDTNDFYEEGTPEGATNQMVLDQMVKNIGDDATVLDVFATYQNAGCFDSGEDYNGSVRVDTPTLFDPSHWTVAPFGVNSRAAVLDVSS